MLSEVQTFNMHDLLEPVDEPYSWAHDPVIQIPLWARRFREVQGWKTLGRLELKDKVRSTSAHITSLTSLASTFLERYAVLVDWEVDVCDEVEGMFASYVQEHIAPVMLFVAYPPKWYTGEATED